MQVLGVYMPVDKCDKCAKMCLKTMNIIHLYVAIWCKRFNASRLLGWLTNFKISLLTNLGNINRYCFVVCQDTTKKLEDRNRHRATQEESFKIRNAELGKITQNMNTVKGDLTKSKDSLRDNEKDEKNNERTRNDHLAKLNEAKSKETKLGESIHVFENNKAKLQNERVQKANQQASTEKEAKEYGDKLSTLQKEKDTINVHFLEHVRKHTMLKESLSRH